MTAVGKNWIWFVAIMALVLALGAYLGNSRRADLGKSFDYSLDEYRVVDPALMGYAEEEPLVPSITNITSLAIAEDGTIHVGGENAVQTLPDLHTIALEATPTSLALDADRVLFVGLRDHVLEIAKDGTRKAWDSPGEKTYLSSIAADDWYVYVADAGNRRIWRHSKLKDGPPLEIGEKDWANDVRGFYIPSPMFDLAISRTDGSFWAVNPGYHALENYRPDGMPLSTWEASGMTIDGFSGCCNPSHFALLPDGAFVTAEKGLPRVKVHNVDGSLRCVVAAPNQFDDTVKGLDVAVGADGTIFVLDPNRNQVRVFKEIQ